MKGFVYAFARLHRALTAIMVFCWVVAQPAPATAAPGDVVELTLEGRLDRADIDAFIEPLFDGYNAPIAKFAVDVYWVEYETTDLDGSQALITAQVFVPVFEVPSIRPVYVFGPGSTGLVGPCRPSREHIAGIHWGLYRAHVLSHAGQGTIGVLPDYLGFNDATRIQPYFLAEAEGRVLLDAIRAVRDVFRMTGPRAIPSPGAFVAGYSQGGHAAFAAADLRATYAPEVRLAGVIGYGATTDIAALFEEFTVSAPLVIHVYAQHYGEDRFPPSRILQRKWAQSLAEDATSMCIGGVQSYYPWNPEELYTPAFYRALTRGEVQAAYPEIFKVMQENSTGLSGHGVPVLIAQGTEDSIVGIEHQNQFVSQLCEGGSQVLYITYEGMPHDTRQISFSTVRIWMEDRTRGIAAPSDCSIVGGTR